MIHQGHRYTLDGYSVLAMESATRGLVKVRRITTTVPVIGMERSFFVAVDKLTPEPMRYFRGQIPAIGA